MDRTFFVITNVAIAYETFYKRNVSLLQLVVTYLTLVVFYFFEKSIVNDFNIIVIFIFWFSNSNHSTIDDVFANVYVYRTITRTLIAAHLN